MFSRIGQRRKARKKRAAGSDTSLVMLLRRHSRSARMMSIGMFIQWIDMDIPEFRISAVICEIVIRIPAQTRQDVWTTIRGADVREDSPAEAMDLFKLFIHDLSTGHVIRQHREVDYNGNFIKAQPKRRSGGPSGMDDAEARCQSPRDHFECLGAALIVALFPLCPGVRRPPGI